MKVICILTCLRQIVVSGIDGLTRFPETSWSKQC